MQGRNYNTNAADNTNANNALESMLKPEVFHFVSFSNEYSIFLNICTCFLIHIRNIYNLSRVLNFVTRIRAIKGKNVKLMRSHRMTRKMTRRTTRCDFGRTVLKIDTMNLNSMYLPIISHLGNKDWR